ncbi:MAG TPA: hypothetical protein VFP36_11220, partial [Usitatibacter sp.]|nr:hypothetical protein [Usitatibacter sp.]
ALDPVAWILAQADTAQVPAPAAGRATPAIQPSRTDWMALFFQDTPGGRRLQVAPVRWSGNVSFEERITRASGGASLAQSIEVANLAVATYVGQPWLVQVRGNLGFLTSQQRTSGDAVLGNADRPPTGDRSTSLLGGGTVSVFPSSRFPFTATFDATDSRASGEASASDYTSRRLSLRQSYRTPLGDQVYLASLDHSALTSSSFGRDTVTSLDGSMQRTFRDQVLDVAGAFSANRRSLTGDGTDLARLSARHSWRPEDTATLDSFASFSSSEFQGPSASRTRFLQLNSFGTWRPEEESPLFVTGGVRAADSRFNDSTSRTLAANGAMSYALNPYTHLIGTLNVAALRDDAGSAFATNESLAANYTPAPHSFAGFSYAWNTSGSVTNQTGGVDGAQHGAAASLGHQLSRGTPIGDKVSLFASVNQTGALEESSLRPLTRTLQHSATVSLRASPTSSSDGLLAVTGGDSRAQGGRTDHFRLLNVQATGQVQLGVFSLVTANLTVQAIRQAADSTEQERSTVQRSGNASYQHSRLFGVRRLRFMASANFNDIQLESRLLGDVSAPHDQYTRMYETKLLYDIGRLDFQLGTRFATFDGRSDRQLFFRVNRQFGLY